VLPTVPSKRFAGSFQQVSKPQASHHGIAIPTHRLGAFVNKNIVDRQMNDSEHVKYRGIELIKPNPSNDGS